MNPTIRGNVIDEAVLREVRSLLVPPRKRIFTLIELAVFIGMTVVAIVAQLYFFIPIFVLLLLFFLVGEPYMRQSRVIANMVEILRKTYGRPSCAFDVTFEEACVRSVNVKTRETVRLPYTDFVKMVRGKTVIALVSRKGHLVVVQRARTDEATCDAVMEIIKTRCPYVFVT